MAKDFFRDVYPRLPKRLQAKAHARYQQLDREMLLRELRESLKLTQAEVAKKSGLKVPNVSRLERQSEMQIATLRKVVAAMGGELEIVARFRDTAVKIMMPA